MHGTAWQAACRKERERGWGSHELAGCFLTRRLDAQIFSLVAAGQNRWGKEVNAGQVVADLQADVCLEPNADFLPAIERHKSHWWVQLVVEH